ncbi:transporter [Tenacibaculum sp. 190524A02b]|uniref:transporter n=1 Tax=Tenacibaculum vairaonense TaxID=3137860 RepID=UPI0031FAE530
MLKSKSTIYGVAMSLCFPLFTKAQTLVNGFYPQKNKLTIATSYAYKTSDRFYRGTTLTEGNPANLGEISSSIFSVYADYGINDWLSAVVSLPYISLKSEEGTVDPVHKKSEVSGLQDVSLFMKARVLNKNFDEGSKLSIGTAAGISFPMSNYEGNGILSIGNKATTFDGVVVMQYTMPFNLFFEGQTGYSIRSNSDFKIPNALLYSLKLGYYNEWIYAHAKLGGQDSTSGYDIGSAEFGANGGPVALSQTQVDYTTLHFDVYVPVYKQSFGVSAGYGFAIDGRNFSKEKAFSIGLVYKN